MKDQETEPLDAGFFVGTWLVSCSKHGEFALLLDSNGRFEMQHLSGGGINGLFGRAFARESSGIWTSETTTSGITLTLYFGKFSGNLSSVGPLDKAVRWSDAVAEVIGLSPKVCVGHVRDIGSREFSYVVGRPWNCHEQFRRQGVSHVRGLY